MADHSAIQWTDATWTVVTGCDRVSPGCANCYALTMAPRLKAMGNPGYQRDGDPRTSGPGFGVTLNRDRLDWPLRWKKPRRIFTTSMGDLFHPEVPDGFIAHVWSVMGLAGQHTFQVLTKRPERMREWVTRWADRTGDALVTDWSRERGGGVTRARYSSGRGQLFAAMLDDMGPPPDGAAYPTYDWMEGQRYWPRVLPNLWLGTSVENARWRSRIDELRETPAAVRFLSCEPLLGPLDALTSNLDTGLNLAGIDWVIVGGESGPGARPMDEAWVRAIIEACREQGVAVFVKQMGEVWSREHLGHGGHAGDIDEWPEDLRIREFPGATVPV